jgi:hypothetical protein
MAVIRDLLKIDLKQKIEEVITLGQQDEGAVYTEITEYVATDSIRDHYRRLFKAIAEAPAEPTEGVGVWVSGFFGSGKSSFAKNLGYVLANRTVLGTPAAELFKARVQDRRIAEYVDFINVRIPTEAIMFDVSVDRSAMNQTERVAEVMYRVLLRELGYAEDWTIANLEMTLEADGRLDDFIKRFEKRYGKWSVRRKYSTRHSEASAILHEMDPSTYTQPDSWAQSSAALSADISVGRLVQDTFELMARRRPGKAAIFIIDEVGQYVARSPDKILDLQAVVREFGAYGRNMVVNMDPKKKAVAPAWIVVTSQEALNEIVAAIDSRRVELAKLQDSFRYHVDMAPADIREVASRRVLSKSASGEATLRKLFRRVEGQLNTVIKLDRTTRRSEITEDGFVQFYPYLPHYLELSIDIMSGIRLQPGALRHIGGANRTIIKQAYEMLVNERTDYQNKPVGALVTLDEIYELVEGNLSSERRADIDKIAHNLASDPWCARVGKAIALLEYVRDLPRTDANIAASLIDTVDSPSPIENVRTALKKLQEGQFVRLVDDGWKLQTAQEKNWQIERTSLAPKPKDENEIKREALHDIFNDAKLKTFRFEDLRTFRVGITVDDVKVGDEGQLLLQLYVAEDADDFRRYREEKEQLSHVPGHETELVWIVPLTDEAKEQIVELYRSREMIKKYNQLSASTNVTTDETRLLMEEKQEESRLRGRLREKLAESIYAGVGIVHGNTKEGSAVGKNHIEALRAFFNYAVPDLYSKLRVGARPLKGTEAEEVLRSVNLNALPSVFHVGDGGTDLVIERGGKYVPNPDAEIAREVLGFIQRQHAYGNRVTGRDLEEHFAAMPYGWEYEMVLLVLAVLLRAGAIEVTYQGRRFRNHQDPQARVPFGKSKQAFRSSSFAPRQAIELRTLTEAVRRFEELTGQEVDVEETAIATAFKKLAADELAALVPLQARLDANRLPYSEALAEYRATLQTVMDSASDDCVRILAGEGNSLKKLREQVRALQEATDGKGLDTLRQARRVLDQMWLEVQAHPGEDGDLSDRAETLRGDLAAGDFYARLEAIREASAAIESAYGKRYEDLHIRRGAVYQNAIKAVSELDEWDLLSADVRSRELTALLKRADADLELPQGGLVCTRCNATLSQMESDLAAARGLQAQVTDRIRELATPEVKVERVRISQFVSNGLDSEQAIDEALQRLRERLLELLKQGVKIVLE